MFDAIAFFTGLVLGMIILLIIVWVSYSSRVVFFSNCSRSQPYCVDKDYLNDPGMAIAKGYSTKELFHVSPDNHLYYRRPRVANCHHHLDQQVQITHPQYCEVSGREYRVLTPGGDSYIADNGEVVFLGKNCGYGTPLTKWDASSTSW